MALETHKIITIAIPKTGSSAIREFFRSVAGSIYDNFPEQTNAEYSHLTISEFHNLTNNKYKDYKSFCIVRNPYERAISDFQHTPSEKDFSRFIERIPKDFSLIFPDDKRSDKTNLQSKDEIHVNTHTRPQYHYVIDETGKCVVDKIIKFESIDTELPSYLATFNINVAAHPFRRIDDKDIREYFDDPEILETFNEIYQKDFVEFGYKMISQKEPKMKIFGRKKKEPKKKLAQEEFLTGKGRTVKSPDPGHVEEPKENEGYLEKKRRLLGIK
jgi:hypothetical protein